MLQELHRLHLHRRDMDDMLSNFRLGSQAILLMDVACRMVETMVVPRMARLVVSQ